MDKNLVKKVMTFKSGNFAFSSLYDRQALLEPLLEAGILNKTIADLPILPNMASQLDQEVIIKSIFGTAALEGNPLSLEEVEEIVRQKEIPQTSERTRQEIENLKKSYLALRQVPVGQGQFHVTEQLVKDIHFGLTEGIDYQDNVPGRYRESKVVVGNPEHGGTHVPPKIYADICKLMEQFVAWINNEDICGEFPVIRAALAHYHLAIIHPFRDGNGRTARFLEALILHASGIRYVPAMMSNFYYSRMDDYYWAFSKSLKNKDKDVTPFLEFAVDGFLQSLREIKNRVTHIIRLFALRDYYAYLREQKQITKRQHDLLRLLVTGAGPSPFGLSDLFSKDPFRITYRDVTERTARRDLQRLLEMGILLKDDEGKYALNLYRLDLSQSR